jgi:hypothetical protein
METGQCLSSAIEATAKATAFDFARSARESHRDWIEQQLRLKRGSQALYQDFVDQFGFAPVLYAASASRTPYAKSISNSSTALSSRPAKRETSRLCFIQKRHAKVEQNAFVRRA